MMTWRSYCEYIDASPAATLPIATTLAMFWMAMKAGCFTCVYNFVCQCMFQKDGPGPDIVAEILALILVPQLRECVIRVSSGD